MVLKDKMRWRMVKDVDGGGGGGEGRCCEDEEFKRWWLMVKNKGGVGAYGDGGQGRKGTKEKMIVLVEVKDRREGGQGR